MSIFSRMPPKEIKLPKLPNEAQKIVESIETGKVLGASKTIRLLNRIFQIQVEYSKNISGKKLSEEIEQTAYYLIATRGALSPIVENAIRNIFHDFDKISKNNSIEEISEYINKKIEEYNNKSLENIEKIAHYGANKLLNGQTVMAFDYSSSVNAVLHQAIEEGKNLFIIIPESRVINGGKPILRDMLKCGCHILFTADVSIGREIRKCDMVLVGAESITADGGFWNTVGTCSTAILANYYHVPFYVATELMKFDTRSVNGIMRKVERVPLTIFDFEDLGSLPKSVNVECDDLEFTIAKLITGYITEKGVLTPSVLRATFQKSYLPIKSALK